LGEGLTITKKGQENSAFRHLRAVKRPDAKKAMKIKAIKLQKRLVL